MLYMILQIKTETYQVYKVIQNVLLFNKKMYYIGESRSRRKLPKVL